MKNLRICIYKNDTKIKIGLLCICIIWIISALNYRNPDMENYRNLYFIIGRGIKVKELEIGFYYLIALFNKLGFTYDAFLVFYFTIAIFIFVRALLFFDNNLKFVLLLYMIFPFLLDVVQIRNFMAMSIVLYSIHFLTEDSWKNNFLYILGILVASLFHTVSLCYIIFLLCKEKQKDLFYIIISLGIIISAILCNIIPNLISDNYEKIQRYMNGTKLYTKVFFIIYFMLYSVILSYLSKIMSTRINPIERKKIR